MCTTLTRRFQHASLQRSTLAVTLLLPVVAPHLLADGHYQPARSADITHYRFAVQLSDSSPAIAGEAAVTAVFLTDTVDSLTLHLVGRTSTSGRTGMVIDHATENGSPVRHFHTGEYLTLYPHRPVHIGDERVFTIVYHGIPRKGLIIGHNRRGGWTAFADNWPTEAGYWIPVVDHPAEKAMCEFIVRAPSRYKVIAPGTCVESIERGKGLRETRWKTSFPLPPKVMVVGVADFVIEKLGSDRGTGTEAWLYREDHMQGRETFRGAAGILRFLADRLVAFPFEHLAHVESSTRWGGMENATCIFYPEQTVARGHRSDALVAHETAHQWFGDAVSEAEWSDIWLSEGLATFCEWDYGEAHRDSAAVVSELARARDRVLDYLATHPHSTIVDTAYNNPRDMLNRNTYEKAAFALRTLRCCVGDSAFRQGLRDYLTRYLHRAAGTGDFRTCIERAAGVELAWFFEEWFHAPGYPLVRSTWRYDHDQRELVVRTTQHNPYGKLFDIPLVLQFFGLGQKAGSVVVRVDEAHNEFRIPSVLPPETVTMNPGDAAFALVTCTPE